LGHPADGDSIAKRPKYTVTILFLKGNEEQHRQHKEQEQTGEQRARKPWLRRRYFWQVQVFWVLFNFAPKSFWNAKKYCAHRNNRSSKKQN
jgi:hypothetical protein